MKIKVNLWLIITILLRLLNYIHGKKVVFNEKFSTKLLFFFCYRMYIFLFLQYKRDIQTQHTSVITSVTRH